MKMLKLELTIEKRQQLMEALLDLKAFLDVPSALKSLQDVGIKLAFLSNITPHMLESATKSSGLEEVFEHKSEHQRNNIYKPYPRCLPDRC